MKRLLAQSLPGIDEIAALMEIGRFTRGTRYDSVVIDTAPTGHTLRMLTMPRLLETLAVVFDEMQQKHRALVAALRGSWTPEEPDARISELAREAGYLTGLLRNPQSSSVRWVTLPEPMALAESIDGLDELHRLGIRVDSVVVNRVTPIPDRECEWCAARRRFEQFAVKPFLANLKKNILVASVTAHAREPRGTAALLQVAREMDGAARFVSVRSAPRRLVVSRPRINAEPVTLTKPGVSLLMFGGKGGVGKTTCAAAAAIELAAIHPDRCVLALSTDPAHSLGDVLGVPLGNDPRPVRGAPPNLRARELDAAMGFEGIKTRYRDAIDSLFARFASGSAVSTTGDRQALLNLMELAPPGLDELMAIVGVSDALEADAERPLLVVDTAPSGHALRLLEMPGLVHEWVKALMSILLKYEAVASPGDLGALLLHMSRGLGRLRRLMVDPSRTAFVVVTRPAALPMAETERLVRRVERLDIPIAAVVINAIGAGTCSQCTVVSREQQRQVRAIRGSRRLGSRSVVLAPAVLPPPTGPGALRGWRGMWKSQPGGISSRAWVESRVGRRARRLRRT